MPVATATHVLILAGAKKCTRVQGHLELTLQVGFGRTGGLFLKKGRGILIDRLYVGFGIKRVAISQKYVIF